MQNAEAYSAPLCGTAKAGCRTQDAEVAVLNDAGQPIQRMALGRTGTGYSDTLFCRRWRKFINPKGFTCELCLKRQWPEIERFRAHVLPTLKPKALSYVEGAILDAVKRGRLTEAEALELGKENGL